MDPWTLTAFLGLFLLLLYTYHMSSTHGLFKKLAIPGPAPWPIVGNFLQEFGSGLFDYHVNTYNKYKDSKVYGIYRGRLPAMVVRDLDMIRDICVKHFHCFTNRAMVTEEQPFDHSLIEAKDDHWKHLRTAVSPTFNTTRLKRMLPHIERNTRIWVEHLKGRAESGEPVELKDTCQRFTMDVIAAAGFGVEINSLEDKNNGFIREGTNIMNSIGRIFLVQLFLGFARPLLRWLGVGSLPRQSIDFFAKFGDIALEERKHETTGSSRSTSAKNDFLQLMVEAEGDEVEDNDNMSVEEREALGEGRGRRTLSKMDIQGQAINFVLAGYETSSASISFTLFCLAMNPQCLHKVHEEVDEVMKGKFPTYEACQSLPYLDQCINETLRLYPQGFLLDRMCSQTCEIQGVTIPEGCSLILPICAIHRDPALWPDPDTFNPDRFTPEMKASRHPYAHSPFGQGPRSCIGMRLALLEMKVAIAALLTSLTPVPCDLTKPIRLKAFIINAKDGLWVKFQERKPSSLKA